MPLQQIRHHRTGTVLFEGRFATTRQAAEQAVRDGVCLDGADFTRANLVNASLDDAQLRHALFRGANLMGANISEAKADGADFTGAGLQNACLARPSLKHCIFDGALFGATDIGGSMLDRSRFSTTSALLLKFADAAAMDGCIFTDATGVQVAFSLPPVAVTGMAEPLFIFDRHVRIGTRLLTQEMFLAGAGPGWLQPLVRAVRPWETLRRAG